MLLENLALERLNHLLVRLGVESGLIPLSVQLFRRALLDRIELLMLLELVQGLPLLLNHVAVSEWEVIHTLYCLHSQLVALPFALFIFQNLVGLNEGIHFVGLILLLIQPFFVHLFSLELQKALLVLTIPYLVNQLSVSLLVDLVDNLSKEIIVV